MRRAAAILALASGMAVTWAATVQAQGGDVRAALEAANRKFGAAAAKGDAAAVAALYTADAKLFPPNAEPVSGTAAITEFWKGQIGTGVNVTLTAGEVSAHGALAHEVGTFDVKSLDGAALDSGHYIVIWKNDGGQWKLHRDIWNSSK